jgi:acetolactate synthase small subunit
MGRKITDQSLLDFAKEQGKILKKSGIEDDYKPRGKPKELNIPEKPKKESKTKSKVEKLLKEVKSTKIPKNVKTNLVSMLVDIVEDVSKAPKTKGIETESVNEQIKEIEKVLKAPKKTVKKLIEADKLHLKYHPSEQDYKEMKMDQKIYKNKVTNVEPHIANYVATYKELMNKDNKGGARTRAINKHISNFMQVARPSDISTANVDRPLNILSLPIIRVNIYLYGM